MLERLSFRHLRTLRYLYQTNSMRDTARLVNRSQPAVSLQIKDLEEIVGFKIIFHQRGSIFFTDQGQKFANTAAMIEEQLKSSVGELKCNPKPTVKVGITQDLYAACGQLLRRFQETHVELLPMNSLAIIQGCSDGTLQLGIAKTGAPMPSACKTWEQQLNWASRIPDPTNETELDLVLLAEGCHYHELALKSFEHAEPDTISLSICDGWQDIAMQLRRGGVTIVPSSWRGVLGAWPSGSGLPSLPNTTLNLIMTPSESATVAWAAKQLSSMVSGALSGACSSVGENWSIQNIKLFQ